MSTLKVDNLLLADKNKGTGRILEVVSGVCDGRSITTISGTYSLENVTAVQLLGTSYVDVTGSTITYTPPEGTKTVVYEFWAQTSAEDGADGIGNARFYIDDVEVVSARHAPSPYRAYFSTFKWPIQCNASTANSDVGSFTSWTTSKTLKIQGRSHSTSADIRYHNMRYLDGSSVTSQLTIPTLTITAIG